MPAGEPRACAGDVQRADRADRAASASASSTRPASTRRTAPARRAARGLGMDKSLPILAELRETFGVPVLTDVHAPEQCAPVAEAVDVLQIPAFLCRQTDLLRRRRQDRPRDQRQEGPVPGALGHEERRRQVPRRRQRQRPAVRARRQLRLQHAGQRHARAADPGRHRLSGGVRRDAFGAAAGRAGHDRAAASANSCRCWRAPPSRSASPPSSWRRTRTPTRRRPTAPTWCRSSTCRRVLETLLAFDKIAKSRPIENIAP